VYLAVGLLVVIFAVKGRLIHQGAANGFDPCFLCCVKLSSVASGFARQVAAAVVSVRIRRDGNVSSAERVVRVHVFAWASCNYGCISCAAKSTYKQQVAHLLSCVVGGGAVLMR
jgi:hypothetical protein